MHTSRIAGLYAIADSRYLATGDFATAVAAALRGGARVIQYRDKSNDAAQRTAVAATLSRLCQQQHVPLIVNDDVALAAAVGAAGVHLGRDDTDVGTARRVLGQTALIGVSCYNELEKARAAQTAGADYVAFGSFFASRTKPQAAPANLDLLRVARAELGIPIVAIGGITPENGASVLAAGAGTLAVIEGVFGQVDICAAATRYAQLFSKT